MLGAHGHEAGVDDGVDDGGRVGDFLVGGLVGALEPGLDLEVSRAVEWDGVPVEEIRHHDEVAVGCELVGLDGGQFGDLVDGREEGKGEPKREVCKYHRFEVVAIECHLTHLQ